MKKNKSVNLKMIIYRIIFIILCIGICVGGNIAYKYLYVDNRIEGFNKEIEEDREKLKLLEGNIEKLKEQGKFNDKNDDKVEIESLSDYYKDITESCISNISLIISIFLGIGSLLTVVNVLEIIQIQTKIGKVYKVEQKYIELNALSHLNKGLNYESNGRYNFAIDEYINGLEINDMLAIRNQLANAYAELAEGCCKEKAEKYLKKGIKFIEEYFENDIKNSYMEQRIDKYEAYSIIACLYGSLGKLKDEHVNDCRDKKPNLKKAEIYFSKSLRIYRDYKYIQNYALTLYYLGDIEKMIKYFRESRTQMEEIGIENQDVMNVFSSEEVEKIGLKKWNEYREKVGLNKDDEEKYKERCNKKCEVYS